MACPKCGSNNIATSNKGYGIGKGVVGAALVGPLGLMAGNIGKNDIKCTCLDCGHQWDLKKQIQQQEQQKFEQDFENMSPKEKAIFMVITAIIIFIFLSFISYIFS